MFKTISNSIGIILLLVLVVATTVVVVMIKLIPKLVAKGVDVSNAIIVAKHALNTSEQIINVADALLPNNPAIDILQTIERCGKKAVNGAEQLYLSSQLPIDQRIVKANETIKSALKVLNVEITPEIQTVIDGTIQSEVLALGHKDLTEVQKQAEKLQLQTQNAQLQTQNQQLNQYILQFKNAVSTIQ